MELVAKKSARSTPHSICLTIKDRQNNLAEAKKAVSQTLRIRTCHLSAVAS
jgi:hypothetical protein